MDPSSLSHNNNQFFLPQPKGFKDLKLNKEPAACSLFLVVELIVRSFMVLAVDYLIATWNA